MIEHITPMIKANVFHSRRAPSVGDLLCFELVVKLPLASESLQLSALSNANGRANQKLFLIRPHRTGFTASGNDLRSPRVAS